MDDVRLDRARGRALRVALEDVKELRGRQLRWLDCAGVARTSRAATMPSRAAMGRALVVPLPRRAMSWAMCGRTSLKSTKKRFVRMGHGTVSAAA